jgi:RimJ/RimL family protein N-acetyltransferase
MSNVSKIVLRNKRMSDARKDYEWQKDPELAWLDAAPPLDCRFDEYLTDYGSELFFPPPDRRSFAVDTLNGKHIGNCVYYNIDESRSEAELGIMIGDRHYWDRSYGTDTVKVLLDHIFHCTHLLENPGQQQPRPEVLREMQLQALRSSGKGRLQVPAYGSFPGAMAGKTETGH